MTGVRESLLVRGLCAVLATGLMIDGAAALTINLSFDSGASDSPSFDLTGAKLTPIFQQAADYWEDIIEDAWTLDIEYYYDDLNDPDNFLGLHTNLGTSGGKPTEARIRIDTQRWDIERDWWFDPTPAGDTEFDLEQTLYRDLTPGEQSAWFAGSPPEVLEVGFRGPAVAGGAADGHLDVFSTVIHEMGHALGLTGNVASGEVADGDYDAPASMVRGTNTDILETAPDNYHIADGVALMCSGCGASGLRRMPSATDVLAIAAASGWTRVDLPRQDFLGGSDWNNGYNWEGGNPPGAFDDAFLRLQGSNPTANLSARGNAANLFVGEGDNVDTESFKLDVVDTATVDGFNSDVIVRDGGELEADRVVIQNQAEVFMAGGLLDANRVTVGSDSVLTAASGGSPNVDVQTDLTNNGTIRATGDATMTFTSSGGSVWNLDGSGNGVIEAVTGDVNFASGSMSDEFDGDMIVGAGHNLTIAEPWELGPGGVIDLNGGSEPADAARLGAGGLLTAPDGRIEATGDARILPDVEFGSSVQVSVPGASDSLSLYGTITYEGGSYTGAGLLRQDGAATVETPTTIGVDTYDMDGTFGTTELTLNEELVLDVVQIDTVGSSFDGIVNVNNPGTLTVNTPGPWIIGGTANLDQNGHANTYMIRGADVTVSGQINVTGATAIGARVDLTGEINLGDPGDLIQLGGSNANTIDGGRIVGPGAVSAGGGSLTGNGSISADVEFFASADLMAEGGTLAVSGTILEVGSIGTAAGSGRLQVAHAWNTNVADRLELSGGEVTGAGITNDGLTTGHGLLTPARFDNNGTLSAAGGTLTVQPAVFPDLDGTGAENGAIDTGNATIYVPGDLGGLFNFNGTLTTRSGGEFRMDFGGLIIRSGANPGRMKMNGGRYTAPRFRQQSALTVDTATATIDSRSEFDDGSTNTLSADLQLLGTARIYRGALLTGSGDLVVGPGASLHVEHGATLDVDLVNHGTLHVGFSPGAIRLSRDYLQADGGILAIEIGGITPGSGHDQLRVAGRLDLSAARDAMLLDWLPSDAASMFGGKYEVATYGSAAGEFDTVGGGGGPYGIGKAYVADVDYGDGTNDRITLVLHDLLAGDADLDGDVDFGDYLVLEASFGGPGEWKHGDFDLNGSVDFGDYLILEAAFGSSVPAESAAVVPEPGTWAMLLAAAAGMLACVSRRSKAAG